MVDAPVLSAEERRHWDQNGFLVVRNCLDEAEVSRLSTSLSALAEESASWSETKRTAFTSSAGNGRHLDIVQLPFLTDDVHFLMDHPNIFGRILSLMGPYIYIPGMEYLERHSHDGQLLRLHTDGGGSLRCIFPSPDSLVLQLKVQFFLTDTDQPDSGNFMLVPASHRARFPHDAGQIEQATRRAVPVLARRGDALIFPWSLWHCVAANRSPNTRRSVISRYAQLWMRPVDYEHAPEDVCGRVTRRRRRLLADLPECQSQGDYYRPNLDQQITEMFGADWRGHPDLSEYNGMKTPIKELFDQ